MPEPKPKTDTGKTTTKNGAAKILHDSFERRHAKAMSKGFLDMCHYYGLDPSSIRR